MRASPVAVRLFYYRKILSSSLESGTLETLSQTITLLPSSPLDYPENNPPELNQMFHISTPHYPQEALSLYDHYRFVPYSFRPGRPSRPAPRRTAGQHQRPPPRLLLPTLQSPAPPIPFGSSPTRPTTPKPPSRRRHPLPAPPYPPGHHRRPGPGRRSRPGPRHPSSSTPYAPTPPSPPSTSPYITPAAAASGQTRTATPSEAAGTSGKTNTSRPKDSAPNALTTREYLQTPNRTVTTGTKSPLPLGEG